MAAISTPSRVERAGKQILADNVGERRGVDFDARQRRIDRRRRAVAQNVGGCAEQDDFAANVFRARASGQNLGGADIAKNGVGVGVEIRPRAAAPEIFNRHRAFLRERQIVAPERDFAQIRIVKKIFFDRARKRQRVGAVEQARDFERERRMRIGAGAHKNRRATDDAVVFRGQLQMTGGVFRGAQKLGQIAGVAAIRIPFPRRPPHLAVPLRGRDGGGAIGDFGRRGQGGLGASGIVELIAEHDRLAANGFRENGVVVELAAQRAQNLRVAALRARRLLDRFERPQLLVVGQRQRQADADQAGVEREQIFHQPRQHIARPRPSADLAQTVVVYVDDDNILDFARLKGVAPQQPIVNRALEPRHRPQDRPSRSFDRAERDQNGDKKTREQAVVDFHSSASLPRGLYYKSNRGGGLAVFRAGREDIGAGRRERQKHRFGKIGRRFGPEIEADCVFEFVHERQPQKAVFGVEQKFDLARRAVVGFGAGEHAAAAVVVGARRGEKRKPSFNIAAGQNRERRIAREIARRRNRRLIQNRIEAHERLAVGDDDERVFAVLLEPELVGAPKPHAPAPARKNIAVGVKSDLAESQHSLRRGAQIIEQNRRSAGRRRGGRGRGKKQKRRGEDGGQRAHTSFLQSA